MNFGVQLIISTCVGLIVGIFIYLITKKRFDELNKRSSNLISAILGLFMATIGWIPFLVNDSIKNSMKFEVLGVIYAVGIIHWLILKPKNEG